MKYQLVAALALITAGAEITALAAPAQEGLTAALQAAINHHPAVKGKQAEVDAQGYNIESSKAGRYPTVSFQGNNLDDDLYQSGVRLQQPLWTFGKIDTAIKQAEAGYSVEQWELRQAQRQLVEETATTYGRIEGIQQQAQVVPMFQTLEGF